MSNNTIVTPNNGNGLEAAQMKMAAQIDNLFQRVTILDGLISDILPGVEKMTKELNNTLNDLRYRFERDETIQLLKKVGDNIPTMLQLIDLLEAGKGLVTDLAPAGPNMVHELNDSINALRLRFERDETFELMKKIGDNIPTFLQMIDLMEAGKGLMTDLAPAAPNMVHELNDSINALRLRFERDETFELMKKVGDNIPTFLQMIDVMEAAKGMMMDLAPAAGNIVHELTPTINELRYALEKDEVITLLKKTGDNIPVFIKLMDFMEKFNANGDLDSNLNSLLSKETEYFLKGLEQSAVVTMKEFMKHPFEPGMKNVLTSLRDPDVQKGMLFMTTLLKNLHKHMLQTVSEAIMSDLNAEDKK